MLMPDNDGFFVCKNENYKTSNIFDYLEHSGVEYDWMVRLNRKYSLNLYTFLSQLAYFLNSGDDHHLDDAWDHIQSVSLLLVNASGDDFEDFMKETELIHGTEVMFDQIERMLDENGKA